MLVLQLVLPKGQGELLLLHAVKLQDGPPVLSIQPHRAEGAKGAILKPPHLEPVDTGEDQTLCFLFLTTVFLKMVDYFYSSFFVPLQYLCIPLQYIYMCEETLNICKGKKLL